jgi:Na+/H+ antiporter NhaD/arsenite permease-like protein
VLSVLFIIDPQPIHFYPTLVDWPTMATLTGLLVLTKGLEISGSLHWIGSHLISRIKSERTLAMLLVAITALLATILTNDVALFVVVPLTLTLNKSARSVKPDKTTETAPATLPISRLIIFEALAANAGATLTPIGNPQNMVLWHTANLSFPAFTLAMLPLAAMLVVALLALTYFAFSGRNYSPSKQGSTAPVDRRLLSLSLVLYPLFLIMTDMRRSTLALASVLVIFIIAYRSVLMRIDWILLLVFALMFIDLRLIAETQPIQHLLAWVDLSHAARLYWAAIAASQVISNVPATILLSQFSIDWRTIAFGANVGGAGLAIGSLANIIALRLSPERRIWLQFHAYSIPFLAVTAALGYVWLRLV